jgi:PAS domain S-box-containing protein
LRESEQRYRVVTEASPIMVWMAGLDKLCYYFNKGWLDFVGSSLEREIGNGWAEGVHPDDLDRCLQIYVESFDARRSFEMRYRLKHHTGQYRWILDRGVPRYAPDGAFEGYVGGCLDIHDQKEAEELLRQSEERFRALVNASSDVVYRMSPDWSEMRQLDGRGFMTDTGKPRKDWLNEYIHGDDQSLLLRTLREAVTTKSMFQLEHRVRQADGTVGWTYSRAVPLVDAKGEIVEWFGAASDVTARKEAEEKYRKLAQTLDAEVRARTRQLEEQAEQVRELSGRLLRSQDEEHRRIARELHDSVGQLLAALSMNIASVQNHRLDPEVAQALGENAAIVDQITREIRTISHLLHPPLLDVAGLLSAVRWYVDGFSERSKIEVELDLPEKFPRLPDEMEIAIFRLIQECLTNIHRHSGSATARITIREENSELVIEIKDWGKGIPPGKQIELSSGRMGVGFRGMRERLKPFAGKLEIHSNGDGTLVTASMRSVPEPAEDRVSERVS